MRHYKRGFFNKEEGTAFFASTVDQDSSEYSEMEN